MDGMGLLPRLCPRDTKVASSPPSVPPNLLGQVAVPGLRPGGPGWGARAVALRVEEPAEAADPVQAGLVVVLPASPRVQVGDAVAVGVSDAAIGREVRVVDRDHDLAVADEVPDGKDLVVLEDVERIGASDAGFHEIDRHRPAPVQGLLDVAM